MYSVERGRNMIQVCSHWMMFVSWRQGGDKQPTLEFRKRQTYVYSFVLVIVNVLFI